MVDRRRPWGAAAAAASIALALTVTALPSAAFAAPPPSVPSPQDIAAAKRSESAKQAEIGKLTGLLAQYQQISNAAQSDAQAKGELYSIAMQNLDAATQKAAQLSDQQKAAEKQAATSRKKAAAIIAQIARTGGGDVTLGLVGGSGKQADELLQRLGSMNRLSQSSQGILEKAEFDQNAASSLAKQAAVAKTARAARADDAKDALSAAQDAASAANTKVASVEASQSTMYAQLADLKGTTAELEKQASDAKLNPATTGAPTPGSGGGAPPAGSGSTKPPANVDPTPPAPSPSAVATAIAYARAQIGEPYVYGGAGPNGWDCSGLTMQAYAAAGVYIGGHGSTSQYNYVRLVPRSSGILPGDLIFYSSPASLSQGIIDHVTLAIGGGQMIEAPSPGKNVRQYFIYTQDLLPYVGRPTG
jgi:cell wall-associated NlpC family hydrolase